MSKKKIRLSPEYHCNPVWGDVDEEDFTYEELLSKLGLSVLLLHDLELLQDIWDATYENNDPGSSGFKTKEEQFEFDSLAVRLLWELHKQLPDCQVSFYSCYSKQEVVLGE